MNNTTLRGCGFAFLPIDPERISSDVRAVLIVRIAFNALTCPLIVLLNILVMVAVKTKRQLRTMSNIALACLATTDLVVGLVLQPLHIISNTLILKGETDLFCSLSDISMVITMKCLTASFNNLILTSAERYLAIKHTFAHENRVTAVRIIIASGLAWVAAIIFPIEYLFTSKKHLMTILAFSVMFFIYFPAMVYFNVAVYKEVRRSERQIAANQVSLEAREKILKNKRAFYTTVIVIFAIFLSYIPASFCVIIVRYFKDSIPANVGHIVLNLVNLLPILNSLFNPLIYVVRIRYFRVAFIQLLSRKTVAQAEELEMKIFGPRQDRVIATAEQGQRRARREENVQQGNTTTMQPRQDRVIATAEQGQRRASREENVQQGNTTAMQPHKEYEETAL